MDLYKVLGIPSDANTAAIEKAFRALSLKYHPDKVNSTFPPNRNESQREREAREKRNHEQYVNIVRAREILSDPAKREKYDWERRYGPGSWKSNEHKANYGRGPSTSNDNGRDRSTGSKTTKAYPRHGDRHKDSTNSGSRQGSTTSSSSQSGTYGDTLEENLFEWQDACRNMERLASDMLSNLSFELERMRDIDTYLSSIREIINHAAPKLDRPYREFTQAFEAAEEKNNDAKERARRARRRLEDLRDLPGIPTSDMYARQQEIYVSAQRRAQRFISGAKRVVDRLNSILNDVPKRDRSVPGVFPFDRLRNVLRDFPEP
ncbi:DnaJ-domain-containing protein [Xylariaceae sp. AK1471]|nr:DnaJ-domain-containing protein [Xylariaceae sp. AK1471]